MNTIYMGMSDKFENEKDKKHISEHLKKAIQEQIEKIRGYTPKIGVFGDSGVGKSSLCNALFGKDVAMISDVEACTRMPQEIFLENSSGSGIVLIDVPGVGEDPSRHKEYMALYKSLAPNLDLIIWVISARSRSYASSLEAYENVFKNIKSLPVVFAISQADQTQDTDDWNRVEFTPSGSQIGNIAVKENDISRRFNIPTTNIVSIAIKKKDTITKTYNLEKLVERIVEALPSEKKYSFTREAREEFVSQSTAIAAEKGIWDTIKDMAGNAWDYVKDDVTNAVHAAAPILIKKTWDVIKSKKLF